MMLKTLPSTKIHLHTSLVGDIHVWDMAGGLRQRCCWTPFCKEPSHHKQWFPRTLEDPCEGLILPPLQKLLLMLRESHLPAGCWLRRPSASDPHRQKPNMASQHGPRDLVWSHSAVQENTVGPVLDSSAKFPGTHIRARVHGQLLKSTEEEFVNYKDLGKDSSSKSRLLRWVLQSETWLPGPFLQLILWIW